ncbi:MAG: putative membrane-bound spermidine synthase [Pseudoalteromonas tetraodonis]|jgi:predicted membrane-bound spermidine synthase
MSLKGFHVLFITLATLCLVGFAVWAFMFNTDLGVRVTGVFSGMLGVALSVYGTWFYQNKLKDSTF